MGFISFILFFGIFYIVVRFLGRIAYEEGFD